MISPLERLEKILNDKSSGSTDILIKLNKLLKENSRDKRFLKAALTKSKLKLSHFAAVKDYIDTVSKLTVSDDRGILISYLNNLETKEEDRYLRLFNNAGHYINNFDNINNVLTLSNSGTMRRFFYIWGDHNPKLKVIICESRPKLEGRILAKSLLQGKIKVELITDASAALHMPETDAVIVGADAVLTNGNIVNKIGSRTLAVLCGYFGKPFYAVAPENKHLKKKTFNSPEESPDEIWGYKDKNLRIKNTYFELVERDLITAIISDKI